MAIRIGNTDSIEAAGLLLAGAVILAAGFIAGKIAESMRLSESARRDRVDDREAALYSAPYDDEEDTEEEADKVAASLAEYQRGELIPWEERHRSQRAHA